MFEILCVRYIRRVSCIHKIHHVPMHILPVLILYIDCIVYEKGADILVIPLDLQTSKSEMTTSAPPHPKDTRA